MNYGLNLLLSGAVAALITGLSQWLIKNNAEKNLENHKQKLNIHTENLKFDLQKKIHDYGLYSVKRHEIYPELFKLLLLADGNVHSLYGFRRTLSFKEFNKDDIKIFMQARKVSEGKQNEVLNLWDEHKEDAIDELEAYLRVLEIQDARRSLIEAKNYLLLSDLFLSESVSLKSDELFRTLNTILVFIEFPSPGDYIERDKLSEGIKGVFADLKILMKKELSDIDP
ncbi:hypothetical protein NSS79_25690 [Paenibacillus sp. FSL L8-0436]|uniref:hypothetical protein n=1 Tax=Paenibacillus sp. FSL L8-0436 TaxID=2954686 RepID=UPI0031598ED7